MQTPAAATEDTPAHAALRRHYFAFDADRRLITIEIDLAPSSDYF